MTQRDADMVLGIFAPNRYGILDHRGYNISKLQDNYRQVNILKNRQGEANIRIGLLFNGKTSTFKELPRATEMSDSSYTEILRDL